MDNSGPRSVFYDRFIWFGEWLILVAPISHVVDGLRSSSQQLAAITGAQVSSTSSNLSASPTIKQIIFKVLSVGWGRICSIIHKNADHAQQAEKLSGQTLSRHLEAKKEISILMEQIRSIAKNQVTLRI